MRMLSVIIILLFATNLTIYANELEAKTNQIETNFVDKKMELLNNYDLVRVTNFKIVTRSMFIESVMKTIGANDEIKEIYSKKIVEQFRYSDILKNGYAKLAIFGGVAKGWNYSFRPNDPITYKQAYLFMMRCLKNYNSLEDEISAIFDAEEIGLLKNNDEFYNNLDSNVTKENYYELIYRFLNSNGYRFYCVFKPEKFQNFDGTYESYKEYVKNAPSRSGFFENPGDEITYLRYLSLNDDEKRTIYLQYLKQVYG